jgi:hypothetical protein
MIQDETGWCDDLGEAVAVSDELPAALYHLGVTGKALKKIKGNAVKRQKQDPLTRLMSLCDFRRPLPHTVGERCCLCDFAKLHEMDSFPPLPHRVGERSRRFAAGEGAFAFHFSDFPSAGCRSHLYHFSALN